MANSPTRLAMILIDPKGHAFSDLADLPHLARPIVTTPEEAIEALRSTTRLMDKIGQYQTNRPRIAIFIDEFGD
ncbi:MAG: hypothetical protein GWN58_07520, partial [Anaerolineae bacterium]|nr:hypothetical protein [Anaerolineae bacterium]